MAQQNRLNSPIQYIKFQYQNLKAGKNNSHRLDNRLENKRLSDHLSEEVYELVLIKLVRLPTYIYETNLIPPLERDNSYSIFRSMSYFE